MFHTCQCLNMDFFHTLCYIFFWRLSLANSALSFRRSALFANKKCFQAKIPSLHTHTHAHTKCVRLTHNPEQGLSAPMQGRRGKKIDGPPSPPGHVLGDTRQHGPSPGTYQGPRAQADHRCRRHHAAFYCISLSFSSWQA